MTLSFRHFRAGFTLIELSIVLVIIGLIVGGVLAGNHLIQVAQMRATVQQTDSYKAAMSTFRVKYNGMPGDLMATAAANFGMQTRSGADGHGDGDGLLESCSGGRSPTVAGCETVLFWRDLSYANLIGESFTTATDALATIPAGSSGLYYPTSKLGRGVFIPFYESLDSNFLKVGNHLALTKLTSTDGSGNYTVASVVTPWESWQIDQKIDDGLPNTGFVQFTNATTNISNKLIVAPFTMDADLGRCYYLSSTLGTIYTQVEPTASRQVCDLTIALQ